MRRLVLIALLLAAPRPALAQEHTHRLRWSDEWARVHPAAYVIGSVGVAGSLVLDGFWDPGPEAHFTGPALFDAPLRARLAATSDVDRERAASVSDALLAALIVWPFVDSLGVVGAGDQNPDVLWQLTSIAAESIAADFILSSVVKLLVHRERPHGQRCTERDRAENPARCGTRGRTRSFYSGHASAAFNSAGLVCISHANLPIYGGSAADALACGGALLVASVIGVLRVVADRHYATDVLVGSIAGLLTGMLLPWALHYRGGSGQPGPEAPTRLDPLRAVYIPLVAGSF